MSLPNGLTQLLGLNLKFCPTPSPAKRPYCEYQTSIDQLIRSIKINTLFKSSGTYNKQIYVPNPSWQPPELSDKLFSQFLLNTKEKLVESIKIFKFRKRKNLNFQQRKLISDLRNNKSFKFMATDKNLGPAVMNTEQYIRWCLLHLKSNDVYSYATSLPIRGLRRMITNWHSRAVKRFPELIRDLKIVTYNLDTTVPARFYGMPKIHKSPMGLRPIVSSVNSPFHGLSKWLDFMLQPYIKRCSHILTSSKELLSQLKSLTLPTGCFLVSWDAQTLYTSIPNDKGLLAISWWLRDDKYRDIILEGLKLLMTHNWFEFGDTFWRQTHGAAMGTPVAPSYANLYLGYYELNVIFPMFKSELVFYTRYIDDVFHIFRFNPDQPWYFNRFIAMMYRTFPGVSWSPTSRITDIDMTTLPLTVDFLDLTLTISDNIIHTRTFQKALNLYLYPTPSSAHPPGTFSGLITGLIRTYFSQNSRRHDFLTIIRLLYARLRTRGFPAKFLKLQFEKAYNKCKCSHSVSNDNNRILPFKITYNPNGPCRASLKHFLNFRQLRLLTIKKKLGRLLICYKRPPNLGNILVRAKIPSTFKPNAKELYHKI